ncbi:MAG: polysaccharide biosynthesis protein [Microscillaceae bacterium]|nr:polysaccharide biosynthesis protein [Microscillaceae bacterium]MDW8459697.1 SDR family NAD(P)-dependent oxidoreductase [Cytophagales bacterium]
MLADRSILVTGGTGSFGKHFVFYILERYPEVKNVIVFSRDEQKQYEMKNALQHPSKVRFVIGDVRDYRRVYEVLEGVDYVIHAAAMKHIHIAEENPVECIKTNILGSENVASAARERKIKKVIVISTDKAVAPAGVYGASKLCADKIFLSMQSETTKFTIVRYANVLGSVGSVVPYFLKIAQQGYLPITHPDMTRFSITNLQASQLVEYALQNALGGEILVPKLPSYRILDLAEAICPHCEKKVVGMRPGEKIHEEMITEVDSPNTIESEQYFIIVPNSPFTTHKETMRKYLSHYKAQKVAEGFTYSSKQNINWLNVEQIREQIRLYVDSSFNLQIPERN